MNDDIYETLGGPTEEEFKLSDEDLAAMVEIARENEPPATPAVKVEPIKDGE